MVGDFFEDPGDETIIELAFTRGHMLITLDKDFGELAVFRGKPHRGIIRMAGFSAVKQGQVSVQVPGNYNAELEKSAIITVEKDRVRIQTVPMIPRCTESMGSLTELFPDLFFGDFSYLEPFLINLTQNDCFRKSFCSQNPPISPPRLSALVRQ